MRPGNISAKPPSLGQAKQPNRRTESERLHAALTVTLPSETAAQKADQALPLREAWGGLDKDLLTRMVSAYHSTGSTGSARPGSNRVRPRHISGARRRLNTRPVLIVPQRAACCCAAPRQRSFGAMIANWGRLLASRAHQKPVRGSPALAVPDVFACGPLTPYVHHRTDCV